MRVRLASPGDTIAALSTPPGEGGIGIVRLSGPEALSIAAGVFVSARGRDICANRRQRVFYGEIRGGDGPIDEVLVHVMRAPASYTKEDVVEINCHGGALPLREVLELVLSKGARLAEPGEFTRRAFVNGRIDLVQAEAVIDKIRAQTRAGLRASASAARGALSKSIHEIREGLAGAKANIEAAIDFPDHDVPELITPALEEQFASAKTRIEALLDTAEAGRLYREGASVALAGRANVGKSSLFNALLRESRAIVTPAPGTTRDVLEEVVSIEGIPVRLIDMAGLRDSVEEAERIGVARARETLHEVAAVVFVLDGSLPLSVDDEALAIELADLDIPVVAVLNKIDLPCRLDKWPPLPPSAPSIELSAKTGAGIPELESALAGVLLGKSSLADSQAMISRVHQKESLRRALQALQRLLANFRASPEFLSIDLDEALQALGEITGETTPDEVLDRIFSTFCIGK